MANEYDESIIYDKDKGYFAAKPSEECVSALEDKTDQYYNTLETLGWWDKLRNMYAAWHGAYNNSVSESHQITFTGDDGELVELVANHLRNLGRHMHTMVTSVRPAMETRAINTDYKSQVQTKLGNGLLDYYMRSSGKDVETRLKLAVEYGICLGGGWIKLSWNPNAGSVSNIDVINEAKQRVELGEDIAIPDREYEGDLEFSLHSPFDVVEDLSQEDPKQNWRIVRSTKNRYDLIKVYPELTQELMDLPGINTMPDMTTLSLNRGTKNDEDKVLVWEFYHDRTESLPEGRYVLYCDKKTILHDGDLPYRRIPLYSLKPSRVLGTTLGYSDLFDILPLQEAINTLYSTILTNQAAFGVQTILNPTGNNIDPIQLSEGLSLISYNAAIGKPEALQLTATPPEIFNYLNFLIQTAETISGINSVVRGNPEASLRSGSAIAMIQSNAIQYMSNLQAEYVHLIEDVGLGILQILIDFADSPRIADIVGESGKSYVKTFKGADLRDINRVIVDSANPMTKTIAGRINMADNLLQYGEITPKQYMNIVNTGNIETATDGVVNEEMSIKKENEAMMEGDIVNAFYLDLHMEHIKGHRSLVSDPDMRKDPELLKLVGDHINQHIELLTTTRPDILMSIGEQPLQPAPQAPTAAPQGMEGAMTNPATQPPQAQAINQTGAEPQQPGATVPEEAGEITVSPEENLARINGGG